MPILPSSGLKQRVLVVEDDQRMLELMCKGLREFGHTPMPASDGDSGLELALNFEFDSIILDIGLPGRNGYSVARAIRSRKSVPILMLTARDREEDILKGFDFGADDYLTKPFSFREMLARLNVLGRSSLRNRSSRLTLDSARLVAHRGDAAIQLTRSEFLLLAALHQNGGASVDRQRLADAIWGTRQTVSANTLDVLVNALRGKLDGPYPEKMLHTVRGIGYRLEVLARRPEGCNAEGGVIEQGSAAGGRG